MQGIAERVERAIGPVAGQHELREVVGADELAAIRGR